MTLLQRLDRLPRRADWGILLFVLLLIWLGSSIPPAEFPDLGVLSYDKVLHVLEYFVLGSSLCIAGRRRWLPWLELRTGSILWAVLLGIVVPGALWAISDEFHQMMVGRDCNTWDWLADVIGLLLAALVFRWLTRQSRRSSVAGS